jgi:predicted transport protein
MSDIKLFRYGLQGVSELEGKAAVVEKQLQQLIENHMESFLGIRFLASEYNTGKTHKGRIDSLGLDENGCPVIIEYKRYSNENVINQGLFYLDWLLDHQAEFRWLVMETWGKEVADSIEWSGTRLLCIAGDFTRYDQHAVQQINRNVELIRYKHFGGDLLMLELVNSATASREKREALLCDTLVSLAEQSPPRGRRDDCQQARLEDSPSELVAFYEQVCGFIESLGDEVQRKELKLYTAFRKLRNFVCVQVTSPQRDPHLKLYLNIPPASFDPLEGISRDMTDIGHWGTGDLELTIRNQQEWDRVVHFVERAYQEN